MWLTWHKGIIFRFFWILFTQNIFLSLENWKKLVFTQKLRKMRKFEHALNKMARSSRCFFRIKKACVWATFILLFLIKWILGQFGPQNSLFLAYDGSKNAPIPKIFVSKKFLWKVIMFISMSKISVFSKKLKKIENEKMPKSLLFVRPLDGPSR